MLTPQREEDTFDVSLRDLRQFARDVAHDLRGPLAGMGMLAVVAQQHLQRDDLASAREDLRRIADQAQWSQVALDALWRLADHLERPLEPRPCSLDKLAKAAGSEAALSVRAHFPGRRLPPVNYGSLGEATLDPGLAHVILVNLISNALKFNLDRQAVEVTVQRNRLPGTTGLVLTVSDNGAGFDPGPAGQVSLPPADEGSAALLSGRGLGLSIVRRAAQRLGGRVEVASSPGKGTQVHVILDPAP